MTIDKSMRKGGIGANRISRIAMTPKTSTRSRFLPNRLRNMLPVRMPFALAAPDAVVDIGHRLGAALRNRRVERRFSIEFPLERPDFDNRNTIQKRELLQPLRKLVYADRHDHRCAGGSRLIVKSQCYWLRVGDQH